MAYFNPSNQLLQIDTGVVRTYLYNSTLALSIYAGIGENQVLGQRFFGGFTSVTNPSGTPTIFMLVQYKSTAQPAPVAAPAPVYWTDETMTTVSGVSTESVAGLNGLAGYLMLNTTSLSSLTAAQLQGAQCLIQVAGVITGATSPASIVAGDWIIGAAGNFTPGRVAAGTAPGYKPYGRALSAVSSGLCDILLDCDNI
jgi:hypothetical protein